MLSSSTRVWRAKAANSYLSAGKLERKLHLSPFSRALLALSGELGSDFQVGTQEIPYPDKQGSPRSTGDMSFVGDENV